MFKRKVYQKLLNWKNQSSRKTAYFLDGSRSVGKTTLVEEFAKKEYCSYVIIDFSKVSKKVISIFKDGFFDYIVVGPYISSKNMAIFPYEQKITLVPLDFEEFLWAIYENGEMQFNYIRECFEKKQKVGINHDKFMKDLELI